MLELQDFVDVFLGIGIRQEVFDQNTINIPAIMMHTSILYGLNSVNYSTVISFLTVSIFCDIFNLDWFVLP